MSLNSVLKLFLVSIMSIIRFGTVIKVLVWFLKTRAAQF